MTNFNISANDLVAKPATAPATPAPATAPATPALAQPKAAPVVPQLTEEDKQALVWANNPANSATPEGREKADAIKAKIQQKLIVK
jgi:hypothetical protein